VPKGLPGKLQFAVALLDVLAEVHVELPLSGAVEFDARQDAAALDFLAAETVSMVSTSPRLR
jgi:hypothetical protein